MSTVLESATVRRGENGTFVVVEADHHRNGVSGEGFYVGVVAEANESHKLVTWFPEYDEDGELIQWQTRIAVLDLDKAATGNIYMHPEGEHEGNNAWRGDHYGAEARALKDVVDARFEVSVRRRAAGKVGD